MRIKTFFLLLLSYVFSQSNSLDIATTGANKLRVHGQMNIFHNPATLGYNFNKPIIDTSKNKEALKKLPGLDKKGQNQTNNDIGNLDNKFTELESIDKSESDSLSIKSREVVKLPDSLISDSVSTKSNFSQRLNNKFSELESIDEIEPDSLSIKIKEVVILPDSLISSSMSTKSHFSMSFFNMSFGLGSGSITPDWINNQLFGGKDLREAKERKEFIKGISNDINIQVPVFLSLPLLNFSFGSNVVSLGQVVSYTSINIPSKLAQVPFVGLEKGQELNINSLEIEHVTYLPISYSKGFLIKPGIIPFGKKSYVGLRSSLLIGLAEVHTENIKGKVQGAEKNTLIDAGIELGVSLPFSLDDSFPKSSFPIGIGFDLGLLTEIDEKLTVGASIDNIFASFKWSGATVYKATVKGELTPEEISETDSLMNFLDQSETKESSSYKTSLPTSINLSGTYKAEKRVILDANVRIDLGKNYWASSTPLFSLGSEFYPETKVPFYFGLSFGGENNFIWGTGASLKIGSVILDISGGQLGGIFNNATGMQFGFGLRIQK
jgi:hypothetical protein